MINNRQAGRRRGRGGNNNGGSRPNGGGGGQRDSGNRIDSRARGNASQLYEKYKNLAADSQRQGDRVTTEYYLQFADHYFRVLSESRARFDEQNQRRERPVAGDGGFEAQPFTGSFDTGFDNQEDEFADEGEPIAAGDQAFAEDRSERAPVRNDRDDPRRNGSANGQQPRRDDRPRDDRPREDRARDERPRDDRPRDDRPRDDRPREDRYRNDQRRDEGGERPTREFARDQAPRDGAPRDAGDGEARRPRRPRDEDVRAPLNTSAPESRDAAVSEEVPAAEAEAPRRRGRPRREPALEDAPATLDAALLPPSLGIAPAASPASGEVVADAEEKPRRRRVRSTPPPEASAAE